MPHYLDRNPHARGRLLREFIKDELAHRPVIRVSDVVQKFNRANGCSVQPNAAARMAKWMVRKGILVQVKQGHYCHSHRVALLVDGERRLLSVLSSTPRRVVDLARRFDVSTVAVYKVLRALIRLGYAARKVKRGWPIGYVITELGEEALQPSAPVNPFSD